MNILSSLRLYCVRLQFLTDFLSNNKVSFFIVIKIRNSKTEVDDNRQAFLRNTYLLTGEIFPSYANVSPAQKEFLADCIKADQYYNIFLP